MRKLFLLLTMIGPIQIAMASEQAEIGSSDGFIPHVESIENDRSLTVSDQLINDAQKLLGHGIDQFNEKLPEARAFLERVEQNITNINSQEVVNKITEVVHKLGNEAEKIANSEEAHALIVKASDVIVKINEQFEQKREDLKPALENLKKELKRLEYQSKDAWEKLKPAVQNLGKELEKVGKGIERLFKGFRF